MKSCLEGWDGGDDERWLSGCSVVTSAVYGTM
jgi:hypothetical protein